MITPEQMEDWIKEVEERPSSAALIVRFIANRLRDLSSRNEELLNENIALSTGSKVEEYEQRIANLEYQLELLRRQLGGELPEGAVIPQAETLSLVIFNTLGQVLRTEFEIEGLETGSLTAQLKDACGEADLPPRLLVTSPQEELLFVFDTGRTVTRAVSQIPAVESSRLDWQQAALVEPQNGEELAALLPVGKMALFDLCTQASRRGCVKRMMRGAFENHISRNYIGTGIKAKPDATCSLRLCSKDDRFVMASREGFLLTMDVNAMPYNVEEAIRLSATDHIVTSFTLNQKPSVLILTQNGKAIHRDAGWLEPALSFTSRGQPIFSASRRAAGVRVVGAAAAGEDDWGTALFSDGSLKTYRLNDLLAAGSVGLKDRDPEILAFTAFELTR